MHRCLALSVLLSSAAVTVLGSAPLPGFRPPSVPLLTQSPLYNSWSNADTLYGQTPTLWTGAPQDLFSAVRVDGVSYVLMGEIPSYVSPPPVYAVQLGPAIVYSTTTLYQFAVGPVLLNISFKSPLLTDDWDTLSMPAHYWTYSAASADAAAHAVSVYADVSAWLVANAASALVSFQRLAVTGVGIDASVTALQLGLTTQAPLSGTSDSPSWGLVYVLAPTAAGDAASASMVLERSNVTRGAFLTSGTLPASDSTDSPSPLSISPTLPYIPPQVGVDRSGNDLPGYPVNISNDYYICEGLCNASAQCTSWAFAGGSGACAGQALCYLKDNWPAPAPAACRVSGQKAGGPAGPGVAIAAAVVYDFSVAPAAPPVERVVTIVIDEILSIEFFGEPCPPYWRRALPIGNASVIPSDMLAAAFVDYAPLRAASDAFDASTADMLSAVGGDEYSTITQVRALGCGGGTEEENSWLAGPLDV